jgi:DNA-directed RNA polymerase specialized sigma24 family protein
MKRPGCPLTVHGVPPPNQQGVTSWEREREFGLELCRRHAEALVRMSSFILEDDDAADEVVSDTIAAVCRYADQPDPREVTRVHLVRSAYHRCLGRLATYERFAWVRRRAGPDAGHETGTSAETLTANERAVVALVLFGDHDLPEAATTLNLSSAAVAGHLRDALRKIRM